MRIAVYPGTFDPITNGHLDILERAAGLFDRVVLAVAEENYKDTLFSDAERLDLAKTVTKDLPNVEVKMFTGLLMDFCMQENACAVIRGLRALSDFEKEFQMALMNKEVQPTVESVFLMTAAKYQFVSSTMVKNFASLGYLAEGIVPEVVETALQHKFAAAYR